MTDYGPRINEWLDSELSVRSPEQEDALYELDDLPDEVLEELLWRERMEWFYAWCQYVDEFESC